MTSTAWTHPCLHEVKLCSTGVQHGVKVLIVRELRTEEIPNVCLSEMNEAFKSCHDWDNIFIPCPLATPDTSIEPLNVTSQVQTAPSLEVNRRPLDAESCTWCLSYHCLTKAIAKARDLLPMAISLFDTLWWTLSIGGHCLVWVQTKLPKSNSVIVLCPPYLKMAYIALVPIKMF